MESSLSKCCCKARLSACGLGIALSLVWGIGVLLLGILAWQFSYGMLFLNALASVYIGFAATPEGIVIGTLWALLDGFIGGVIVAWIYNLCCKRCGCKACQSQPPL